MKVVDLFAGAGGFGLGFKMAGHKLVASIEIDKWACETLRANASDGERVIEADIRDVNASEFAATVGEVDILVGGPPCQGFSVAGPREKDPADPRNALFREFVRFAEHVRPRILVLENVPGLLRRHTAAGERVIDVIASSFINLGYTIHVELMNAQYFGVPQIRERLFVFGLANGLEETIPWARPTESNGGLNAFRARNPLVTLWEAISDMPAPAPNDDAVEYGTSATNVYQEFMRNRSRGVANHVAMKHSNRLIERFKRIRFGESQSDVDSDELRPRKRLPHSRGSTYDQNNRRMYPDRPCHTLPASFYANFLHPFEHRNFTAREGARIQSFPDWYVFKGLRTTPSHALLRRENRLDEIGVCQYNQIGNAVPPLLGRAIGEHLSRWSRSDLSMAG